ncbi:alpha/beta fold hydrolase [Streptomyces sodiiphilus]|uniref:Alpha/beta fold hydrolase n=1 Tax=Streptomyces sodiiphilus TaxID=226217 RepID=A0ABN2PK41_9ACTN
MTPPPDSRWFRRYRTQGPPGVRLVVLPHAGGSAAFYHSWGGAFGPDTEVLVARYPGRQERLAEPCVEAMEPLADQVTDALLPFADVPLALFGHSMGASLAHEVALRLEHRHRIRPACLHVSARSAPHRLTPGRARLETDEELAAEVRRLGGTDTALLADPELRELVLPALRADFRVVAGYPPRPPVPVGCPVTAHTGDADPAAPVADVEEWRRAAPAGFALHVYPGGHFYLLDHHTRLVADLTNALASASQPL